ncbi:MAG: endonuclease domain-containing protein [bacterium]|nr:endonuclease domain-containing protein [bacterium]
MDKTKLRQYARDLRKNSTDAEKHLWYNLRANRMGYKFKRQVPIGSFIVDFVCIEKRLIIELDGGQHQSNQAYDAHRTTELNKRGFQVLRFWNNDVLQQSEAVTEMIFKALSPALSREVVSSIVRTPGAGEGAS